MRQVALRADVAPGTLRNHFRSRSAVSRLERTFHPTF